MTGHIDWSYMWTISASEFKAKCLAILDEVNHTGESLVITKHGKPVAQVSPAFETKARYPQAELSGTVETVGDIIEPVLPSEEWDAEQADEGTS